MPIRINLLAEAQAAEELRRKDPVKRAIILGVACAAVMVAVSIFIQLQVMNTNRKADQYSKQIAAITNDYVEVKMDQDKAEQLNSNIRGLDILASERFLNGTLLNALQKVYVDNIQVIQVRAEENYTYTEEVKGKASAGTPGQPKVTKPATSAERIILIIEARDTSTSPGEQVTKYKDALGKNNYFQKLIGTNNQMRLVNRSPPQLMPDSGKLGVQFTLEAQLPEKVRTEISLPGRRPSSTSTASVAKAAKSEEEVP